ncbi:sugar phosphate isomerase/epimerase [Pullulanibacillus pueri]|uniref:Sugar phosphate isomerase n=1 Tax=Pullulanibacillus pueri TaxID=1437324 RepID=A0A8J2ZZ79_9BACL|nr:sugar phosphate isomerase/epimerase [Pullulanibacillus pueri]MBM7683665.1 sugar phosphate isomerase/epimerase [Pullulanibacillus pueri]GGH87177.1 sugar phosphate isomerase [Pullulanibacillus pueri]
MKFGISSYSLFSALKSGDMTITDVIEWAKEQGAEHLEIVPLGFDVQEDETLLDAIRVKAEAVGIELSNYAIGADFVNKTDKEYEDEIARVKSEVDRANRLGVQLMRHDVAWRAPEQTTITQFEEDLPRLVEACQDIADYAAKYNITTSVENHGFHVQAADRVRRLVEAVNRPNYKTTLDIGNFLCADEDPVASVQKNIAIASMVHFKDFYRRPAHLNPGDGWFRSAAGHYLRGAIVGHGDIDIRSVLKVVKNSGYDGHISIEFEGMEECRVGTKIGLENLKRMWDEV